MVKRSTPPTGFWTVRLIDQWSRDGRNAVPGSDPDKSNAISYMLRQGMLRRYKTVTDIREVTISELDETNPAVRLILEKCALELDPLPLRCPSCSARSAIDACSCGECGTVFVPAEEIPEAG